MRLDPSTPDDDFIRALQRCKEKTGALWSIPFVLSRIFSKDAGLFRLSGEASAWVVVERMDQGEVWMNVWILVGEGLEEAQGVLPLLDELARNIGAAKWRCEGRKGWAKFLKPIATVYERECT